MHSSIKPITILLTALSCVMASMATAIGSRWVNVDLDLDHMRIWRGDYYMMARGFDTIDSNGMMSVTMGHEYHLLGISIVYYDPDIWSFGVPFRLLVLVAALTVTIIILIVCRPAACAR